MSNYQLVCGMEVHAELKTASKMFCGCKNDPFNAPEPNMYTCPTCLGMAGGLPVANKKAIEWTMLVGLALNCNINLFSKFDRKNYFYPDLPKGYQISQYDLPFCYDGYLDTPEGRVGITRVHLEEDTGKLQHTSIEGEAVSLIDFNRGGVPLIEIVTEPDITSAKHASAFGKELRRLLRYLEVADCNMQEGGMRLEANISLKEKGAKKLPSYKVEVKNINSFKFVEQAIAYETKRQTKILDKGKVPDQETRGWNPETTQSFSQRTKEDAQDYRYFPDPDLPPIRFTQKQVDQLAAQVPELPHQVAQRWHQTFDLSEVQARQLIRSQSTTKLLDEAFALVQKNSAKKASPIKLAAAIINKQLPKWEDTSPAALVKQLVELYQADQVDQDTLDQAIKEIATEHHQVVTRYQAGETKLLGFLMGQVMQKVGKKADASQVRAALQAKLST